MYIKNYPAKELAGDVFQEKNYTVAVEDTIELFVNSIPIATILATPEMLKELAAGYLICEGLAKNTEDILDIKIDGKKIYVEMEKDDDLELWHELRSSGCVGVRWEENEKVLVKSDMVFTVRSLKKSLVFLGSDVYTRTRGTHAACLIDTNGDCAAKAIDVGRHNAFDKVVGKAYLEGIDTGRHFILSTGRQSAGMVLKAARAGIPLVATKTAPLNTGIEAAERTGVCLVCFLSHEKFSVFAHPERLLV